MAWLWGAGLAALLLPTCDNRFGFTAPSLRCMQPMLWVVAGFVLALLGAVGLAYAVGSWLARGRGVGGP
jgi:hypothetical protein